MLRRTVLAVLAVLPCFFSAAAHGESIEKVVDREVNAGRYMSTGANCTPAAAGMLGWPASALTKCVYHVQDSAPPRARKTGLVYLANASPERILTWLRTACRRAYPGGVDDCIRTSVQDIRGASGAQFAVSGLVWEDQVNKDGSKKKGDGINEGYVFRNGVTVRIADYANGSTTQPDTALLGVIASEATSVRSVKSWGGFARIMSTTREDFARMTGRTDVPVGRDDSAAAIAWSTMVGDTYRAALAADENLLISAKICAKAQWPAGCRATR